MFGFMEFQRINDESFKDMEVIFSEKLIYCALGVISLFALLGFLLFGTISTELTCTRSSHNLVECSLVRNTSLLTMSPVKILDPLAVDVIIRHHYRVTSYTAEIRLSNVSYTLPLISTYNYKTAQDVADQVNAFLHRSNAVLFSKIFPEKVR